ncbi:MAG: hypothetical protein WHS44_02665 [Fimbriimonadales bacterium]|nr:MAG: hypothetical protein KatS3mg018_2003 [Fimbriimonadales bacterium]
MRRWKWFLGLLGAVAVGAIGWSLHNAIRREPLDAQRFAQMRETEQVEWLIEQTLARSQRTDTLAVLLNKLPFTAQESLRPLTGMEIMPIGMACVEYDLPHWLHRCRRYVERESDREHLQVYLALLQSRKGDWRAAEQTVQRIRIVPVKAFALAHLGRAQAAAGQADAARRSFEQAMTLIGQPISQEYYRYLFFTLELIARYSHLGENPQEVARIVQRVPFNIRMYALGIVEHSRRQRGDTDGLRQMIHQSLPDERAVLKMCLAQALIEQGQVEAGLRELVEIGKCYDYIMAQIAVSLHRHGRAEDARRIVDALRVGLFQRGFPHRRPTNRASEMMRLSTPYGEVRVPFKSPHHTIRRLARAYAEWGLFSQAERVLDALPTEHRTLLRMSMSHAHHEAGRQAQAHQQLERALSETQSVPEHGLGLNRSFLRLEIGCVYALCGDDRRALEVAQSTVSPEQRTVLLCILRNRAYTRNPFWREILDMPL